VGVLVTGSFFGLKALLTARINGEKTPILNSAIAGAFTGFVHGTIFGISPVCYK